MGIWYLNINSIKKLVSMKKNSMMNRKKNKMLPKKSVKSHKCFYPSLHLFFIKTFVHTLFFLLALILLKKVAETTKNKKFLPTHPSILPSSSQKTSLMLQTYFFQNHKHLFAFLI